VSEPDGQQAGEGAAAHRSGTVVLIGRPNAGKSTLLNQLVGESVAITSRKPQTTRHRILGILTEPGLQAALLDTPGVHDAWTELNKEMVGRTRSALAEADVILWIGDADGLTARMRRGEDPFEPEDHAVAALVAERRRPLVFVANKIDRFETAQLLPLFELLQARVPGAESVPVSAKTGDGVDVLKRVLRAALPEGEPQFGADEYTDLSERFLVAEIVREKIFDQLARELPYATHVEVTDFDEKERADGAGIVRISADVVVERDSQKGIVIGKGGARLKAIGTAARVDLEKMLGCHVHLALRVRVEPDWTRSAKGLRRAGFVR
jgi:GTPase